MKAKKIILKAVCFVIIIAIAVGLIIGNNIAFANSLVITSFLSNSTGEDFSQAAEELKNGDEICLQIAEDSIVLLRNEDNALPLSEDVTTLNVFGYGATDAGFLMKGVGSGSSTISEKKQITLLDALRGTVRDYDIDESEYTDENGVKDEDLLAQLKEEFGETLVKYEVNEEILNIYNNFSTNNARPSSPGSSNVYKLDEPDVTLFTNDIMTRAADKSSVALFVISRDGGENVGEIPKTQTVGGKADNSRTYLDISSQEEAMLKLLKIYFDTTIVILNTTNTMHLGFLEDAELGIDACLYVGLTGQSGARAIPEILSGKINPSGKTTDIITLSGDIAKQYDPTYYNNEANNSQIHYVEDIYYGYKWYETADVEGFLTYDDVVAYPFGFGLSYTEFSEEIVSVSYVSGDKSGTLDNNSDFDSLDAGAKITVEVRVTNKGDVAGKDIVELYYTPPYTKGGIEKAAVNLLAFAKTGSIEPNDSHTVTLTFTPYDMASYDCYDKNDNKFMGYELENGAYDILLMSDSHTEIERYTLNLAEGKLIDKDPVTQETVSNHFTGSDAYAGLGVDGKEAGVSQNWLSRADFANTYPTARSTGYTQGSVVTSAANYLNDAPYENLDLDYTQGVDSELYLWTLEDGKKASIDQLTGKADGAITPDYKLFETLSDFEAEEWDDLLDQMTVSEMKDLIEIGGFRRQAVESVGLRLLYDNDGPAGFNSNTLGVSSGDWTAYTSEALMGCSWNSQLMFLMGRAMGAEGNATSIHGWYAPGVNLHRSNYTARNFEYYSEDAVLSGNLAVQVIAGAKTNGLNCYLKHFACSEEGPNPRAVNTWLTEQNLRENYLRPFEIAVKGIDVDLSVTDENGKTNEQVIHVGANSIMTAFNNVGASWAGSNYSMNVSVLRNEWGFRGTLITDYASTDVLGQMYVHQGIRCGNDLWLNPSTTGNRSLDLNNKIDVYCARIAAKNILYTVVDTLNTYNTVAKSGAQLDKYQTTLSDSFKNVEGWWQPVLIAFDCVVALALLTWAVFLVVPVKKLIKDAKAKKNGSADTSAAE